MFCTYCGKPIKDHSQFCGSCGKTLDTGVKYCSVCGFLSPEKGKYCLNCGVKFARKKRGVSKSGVVAYPVTPQYQKAVYDFLKEYGKADEDGIKLIGGEKSAAPSASRNTKLGYPDEISPAEAGVLDDRYAAFYGAYPYAPPLPLHQPKPYPFYPPMTLPVPPAPYFNASEFQSQYQPQSYPFYPPMPAIPPYPYPYAYPYPYPYSYPFFGGRGLPSAPNGGGRFSYEEHVRIGAPSPRRSYRDYEYIPCRDGRPQEVEVREPQAEKIRGKKNKK
ncbi:MAG: zinc-ribbon domain-containing protein [Clostridiales bacterium]|jgi:hypothetical protein|nr:zinc-ribbon domain-containing protein [Clostridiales bacterium]